MYDEFCYNILTKKNTVCNLWLCLVTFCLGIVWTTSSWSAYPQCHTLVQRRGKKKVSEALWSEK